MTIVNNIGFNERSPIARQLTSYQSKFHKWWRERGPAEFLDRPMRLRVHTGAISGARWTAYATLRPNEYRWGIFALPTQQNHIAFGEHRGRKVWNEVPSEYRTLILQHI